MKPNVDLQTGDITAVLFKQDRAILKKAAEKLIEFAVIEDREPGDSEVVKDALDAADTIRAILREYPDPDDDKTENPPATVK